MNTIGSGLALASLLHLPFIEQTVYAFIIARCAMQSPLPKKVSRGHVIRILGF